MAALAFLSYHHSDKELAGNIKAALERYGFDCFLAHEDIAPSVEWQKEILRQLQACDVFIALLTDAFDDSDWTHQEIGIAYARGPIMVLIRVTRNPVGFLAGYQAIRLDPKRLGDACFQIVKSVAAHESRLAQEVRTALIKEVGDAWTFDDAGFTLRKLVDVGRLTPEEVNLLLEKASENRQVYESGRASGLLKDIIAQHRKTIRKGVLRKFYKVWAYK